MDVSMDYFEELIRAEVVGGTPANSIIMMGDSQGAGLVVLFLLTRRLASELGAVISYAGFPPTDLQSVLNMQRDNDLVGSWTRGTRLHMLQGAKDVFVPVEISRSWFKQLQKFEREGKGIGKIDWKLLDGVEHFLISPVWPHVREFLEVQVPDKKLKLKLKL